MNAGKKDERRGLNCGGCAVNCVRLCRVEVHIRPPVIIVAVPDLRIEASALGKRPIKPIPLCASPSNKANTA